MARRLLTVPGYLLATIVCTISLPVLLPLALLATLHPAMRGAAATMLFVTGYLWCETIGIASAFWIWLRHRDRETFLAANYRLQCRWATALVVLARVLFRLRIEVEGTEALAGPPALVLPRHASIADTVIPMVYYAAPSGYRLRYVLKRELLFDPCLDIVGNRLPNYFVDRGGQDSERARQGVADLVRGLGPDEGALIYPEGTRAARPRRQALRERYVDNPDMLRQLDRWPNLLPPRLGGTLAMLAANPGRDLLFCAHAGFEGSSHFTTLLNGAWLGARVRIRFWRVPFDRIPADRDGAQCLLFEQWDRMSREVAELGGPGARSDAGQL